jgi:DNA mismatch repair protein MSH3
MLRDEAYVPFDIDFSEMDGTAKVITGPNMAGASLQHESGKTS